MNNLIKKTWFSLHKAGIHIIPFLWIINYKFIYIYFIIITSWLLNNNKCLISQLEYYIWGETFMGKSYQVPLKHRIILYLNFIISIKKYFR